MLAVRSVDEMAALSEQGPPAKAFQELFTEMPMMRRQEIAELLLSCRA